MRTSALNESFGVEVHDLDLAALSAGDADKINQAWFEHGLLVFREQNLSEDDHLRLAEQLGEIDVNRFFLAVDGHESIANVRKEATDEINIGGGWHTDHSYDVEPARGSILVARDLPPTGGDTRFLSTQLAWQTLPDDLKARVAGLNAIHSGEHIFGPDSGYAQRMGDRFVNAEAAVIVGETVHPLVIAHPATGAPSLYVNPGFTIGIEGFERDEYKALIDELFTHMGQDEHCYQLAWEPGTVAMWDNRSTWHWAFNDYEGHRREMHRITLAGAALDRAEVEQPA